MRYFLSLLVVFSFLNPGSGLSQQIPSDLTKDGLKGNVQYVLTISIPDFFQDSNNKQQINFGSYSGKRVQRYHPGGGKEYDTTFLPHNPFVTGLDKLSYTVQEYIDGNPSKSNISSGDESGLTKTENKVWTRDGKLREHHITDEINGHKRSYLYLYDEWTDADISQYTAVYKYDDKGKLTQVTTPTEATIYTYDTMGNRTKEQIFSRTKTGETLFNDHKNELIAEGQYFYDRKENKTEIVHTYFKDKPIKTPFLDKDGLLNTQRPNNAGGKTIWRYYFDEHGNDTLTTMRIVDGNDSIRVYWKNGITYNEQSEIVEKTSYDYRSQRTGKVEKSTYNYDMNHNWTAKHIYINDQMYETLMRRIDYYLPLP